MRKRTIRREELKFALVHDWLTVPGGSEAVFEQICSLYDGPVYSSQIDAESNKFLKGKELHSSVIQKLPLALTKHQIYTPILPEIYSRMDLTSYDVVLSDSHSFAHGVLRRPDALHINYYHTPARSLWVPEVDGRASKTFLHRLVANRLKKLDLEAASRPDIIFANSQTTADRINRFYKRHVDAVIYPPVQTEKWLSVNREGDEGGFLYWGRLIPYKRVDLAIAAAISTGERLDIVGSGPLEEELKHQAAGHGNIYFWGRLSDEELMKMMANAKALLFPGYEDFGIVPVEAMAAGLPVIAYGAGGVTESVLPEFGVLFDEQTGDAVAAAMQAFVKKQFDASALKNQARNFDVSKFRTQYKQAVEYAIEKFLSKSMA